MKSTAEYLRLLGLYMRQNAAKYGITRMGIYGSVARGEQSPPHTLFTLVHIKLELEALLDCPVDIVRSRERMDEYLKHEIQKEALYV